MSTYTNIHGQIRIYDSTDDLRGAAAKSVVEDDNGVYTDHSTAARLDDTSYTAAVLEVAAQDHMYVGSASTFARIKVILNQAAAGSGALVAEYWDGASWSTLTIDSDGTSSGGDTFAQAGVISFKPPVDWAAGDGGVGSDLNSAFWYVRLAPTSNPGTPPDFDQLWPVDGQYHNMVFDLGDLSAPEGRARPEETVIFHRGRGSADTHYCAGPDAPILEPVELSFSARVGTVYTKDVLLAALTCANPNLSTAWDATGTSTKGDTTYTNGAGSEMSFPSLEDASKKTVCVQVLWTRGGVQIGRAYHEVLFLPDQLQLQEAEDSVTMSVTGRIYGKIEAINHLAYQF
jgi:hypothetical protein